MDYAVSVSYVSQKGETVMACFYGSDRDAVIDEACSAADVFESVKGVTDVRLTQGVNRAAEWGAHGGKVYWHKVG